MRPEDARAFSCWGAAEEGAPAPNFVEELKPPADLADIDPQETTAGEAAKRERKP